MSCSGASEYNARLAKGTSDYGAPLLEGVRMFVLVEDEPLCLLEEVIEGIRLDQP